MAVGQDFTWPKGFRVRNYKGLLACELVRSTGGEGRVLAFWKDRKAQEFRQKELTADLGATVAWTGDVVDLKKAPWWAKSASDFAVKVAAVIGAFAVIGTALSTWLAPPDVAFTVQGPQPIDVARDESFRFDVIVLNNSRTTTTVDLKVVNPPSVSVLQPRVRVPDGGQSGVVVEGAVDDEKILLVNFTATSKAGWIVPARTSTFAVGIKVWPRISYQRFEVVADRTVGRRGAFRAAVAVGETTATSLECLVSAGNVLKGTRFLSVTPSADGGRPGISRGERRAISIGWTMPVRQPFKWQSVVVNLDSEEGRTLSEWQALSASTEWLCEVQR